MARPHPLSPTQSVTARGPCVRRSLGPLCVPSAMNSSYWRLVLMFGIPCLIVACLLPLVNWLGPKVAERLHART